MSCILGYLAGTGLREAQECNQKGLVRGESAEKGTGKEVLGGT